MVDSELGKVDALFADLNRPRFLARGVAGATSSKRFANYVGAEGWDPIDARPVISDTRSVIKSLGGRALYGGRDEVVLRELVANAVDATRLLEAAYPSARTRPVRVSVNRMEDADILTIQDFGIGMSAQEVVSYLCDFGRSGWVSHATRGHYPGALASGFRSTGQFGIGFYSSFMVADDVTVVTREMTGGPGDTVILHFADGLDSRPILREAARSEWLLEPGTRVTLRLRERMEGRHGVFAGTAPERTQEVLVERVQKLARLSDQPIEVTVNDAEPRACELIGSRWLDMPAVEFCALLLGLGPDSRSAPGLDELLSELARRMSPIHDKGGVVVGRLALTIGLEEAMPRSRERGATIYCGGFESGQLSGALGILTGKPETAARESSTLELSRDEVWRWFRDQVSLIAEENLTDSDRFTLQREALSMGERMDDWPIGWTSAGPITADQLVAWAKARSEVTILDELSSVFDLAEGTFGFLDIEAQGYVEIPDDAVGIPWGFDFFLAHEIDGRQQDELDGLEAINRDVEPGISLASWWVLANDEPVGEILRLLSKTWDRDLVSLMQDIEFRQNYSEKGPILLQAHNSRTGRFNGLIVRRRPHGEGGSD
nr:ATP-binding protein [Pedococcus badiiscoriae]